MKASPTEISTFLEKKWFERSGLFTAIILISIAEVSILASSKADAWIYPALLTVSATVIYSIWRICRRIPKARKDKIGFVVSIFCDDDKENEKIKEDFILPLRQLIRSGKLGESFQVIELPQHLAKHINDPSDAQKLRQKTRAHFVLYGRVRLRILGGKEHHIIELEGVVTHKQISSRNQRNLVKEFSELLPRRVHIQTENDLLSFKFTSEWADVVTRYVMGIAAYLSSDIEYAEALYQDVEQRLKAKDQKFPIYSKLAQRLPTRFSEINLTRAEKAYDSWRETHDEEYIKLLGAHLDKISHQHKSWPPVIALTAVHTFLSERDVDVAIRCMAHLKKAQPDTWHLNMAFLRCYAGDLRASARHYRAASTSFIDSHLVVQVEDFMCWVLEQEPQRICLYYGLGFFNWKIKGDLVQAKKDFESFLSKCEPGSFDKERDLVEAWMGEITRQIN